MAAERKEKVIRVLQILQTTDKMTPVNSTHIVDKLENEYVIGKTERQSIYRDIKTLQYCGYPIVQAKDKKKGWYMDKHAFDEVVSKTTHFFLKNSFKTLIFGGLQIKRALTSLFDV